jgi:DivIVA domain-containing protein
MRRGYKVDEVDTFLDRVEATLNGSPVGPDVRSQEVRDVVFRVRFGGYDEWQVDLHLDRVERQLAELEERPAAPGRGAELRASMGGPDLRPGMGGPDLRPGMGGPDLRPGMNGPDLRPGMSPAAPPPAPAPMPDRMGPPPPPLPTRTPAASAPTGALPRYEQPRFEEQQPSYAGQGAPAVPPGPPGSFDGFGGSHGRADMTSEIRMQPQPPRNEPPRGPEPPRVDPYGPSSGFGSVTAQQPVYRDTPPRGGYDADATNTFSAVPPAPAVSSYGGGGFASPPPSAPPMPAGPAYTGELARVDQLRRTFQLRRFGSGYDPQQVDRLFETVLSTLAGRTGGAVNEGELDPGRLNLVPGGYYEAEVEQALREVRDIVARR